LHGTCPAIVLRHRERSDLIPSRSGSGDSGPFIVYC